MNEKIEIMVREAETWLDTPWVHMQAAKGHGVDCVQFIISLAKTAGILPSAYKTVKYSRDWYFHAEESLILEGILGYCDKMPDGDIQAGDIVLMRFKRVVSHAALYVGDGKIIHSVIRKGVVKETLEMYQRFITGVYRLKNG
jgi:cell wall-associated NlpC family hydrolase